MYTKVNHPTAGQNGPMWLYAGFLPILWHVAVTTSYVTFSRLVVGYITKLQARFVLVTSPFQVISRPCRWAQKLTYKVRKTRSTPLDHEGHFCTPPCRRAGNVRAGTGPGPRFGHRAPKSGPTGWAIPPDPQQARGGEIPVQGGP